MPLGQPLFNVSARVIFPGPPPIIVESAAGNGLTVEWSVEKSLADKLTRGTVTIYNLDPAQRAALAVLSGLPAVPGVPFISLYIGWHGLTPANLPGGQPELLFSGDAIRVLPNKKSPGSSDVLTIVEAGDGYAALQDAPPPGGSVAQVTIDIIISSLIGDLGIRPSPGAIPKILEKAAQLPFPLTNFVFADTPYETLNRLIASLGLRWRIENTFFCVYDGGIRNDVLPSILSPGTGLLEWATLDDGGIEFTAVAQARVVPGMQVTFQDEFNVPTGPPMRIQSVSFDGSTVGASTMRGVARKLQLF